MAKKITPIEAGQIIGASPQFVRVAMQQGVINLGIALKMPGSRTWTYNISPNLLKEYVGRDINEELRLIRGE